MLELLMVYSWVLSFFIILLSPHAFAMSCKKTVVSAEKRPNKSNLENPVLKSFQQNMLQLGNKRRITKFFDKFYQKYKEDKAVQGLIKTFEVALNTYTTGNRSVFNYKDPGENFEVVGYITYSNMGELIVNISSIVRTNIPLEETSSLHNAKVYLGYRPINIDRNKSFLKTAVAVFTFAENYIQSSNNSTKVKVQLSGVLNTAVIKSARDFGFIPRSSNPVLKNWIERRGSIKDLEKVRDQISLFKTMWFLELSL